MWTLFVFIGSVVIDTIEEINYAVESNRYNMGLEFWVKFFFIIWLLRGFYKFAKWVRSYTYKQIETKIRINN